MKIVLTRAMSENRRLLYVLAAIAALSLAFVLCGGTAVSLLAFPFGPIGALLRRLSLTGAAGNAAAWALYALFSLLPAAWFLLRKKGGRAKSGDGVLLFLSAALFLVLYWCINPGELAAFLMANRLTTPTEYLPAALALVFDSLLVLVLVWRLLRSAENLELNRALRWVLAVVAALTVFGVFGVNALEMKTAIANVSGSTGDFLGADAAFGALRGFGGGSNFSVTVFMLWLRFLVDAGALLADLTAALLGISLLRALQRNRFGDEAVETAAALAAFCKTALIAVLSAIFACNLLSLLTLSGSLSTNISASAPLLSVAFVLLMLLFARSLAERRELKRENDLFI